MKDDDRVLLDDCLRRIEAGAEPADALAAVPVRDQARLAPLLSVALSLRDGQLAPLRPAFRAGLQATLAELEAAPPAATSPAPRPAWRLRAGMAVAVVAAALCGFGIAIATGYSVPGDAMHPLKLAVERLWWSAAPPGARPDLARRLAAERVREAGLLLARGADSAAVLAALDAARDLVLSAADGRPIAGLAPAEIPRRLAPSVPAATATGGATQAVVAGGDSGVVVAPSRPLPPGAPTASPPVATASPTPLPTVPPEPDEPEPTLAATPLPAPSATPSPNPGAAGVRIGGQVTRDGVPVAGVTVAAWWVVPGQPCADGESPVQQATTLNDGRFEIVGLAPGTYQVSAEGGADCLPRRWFAGAAELAVPDPCATGATLIELRDDGAAMSLANILFDASAGGCPGAGE